MVLICPPISNTSRPFPSLWELLHTRYFFCSLARFKYLSLFLLSLIITLWFTDTAKSTKRPVLCFLLIIIWFDLLVVICLYLQISKNFMLLILWDGLWFVHISCGSIVKLQFLAQSKKNNFAENIFLGKRGSGRLDKKQKEGFLTALATVIKPPLNDNKKTCKWIKSPREYCEDSN